jgi:hypothetical protein
MSRVSAGQFISFRYPPSPTAPGHTGPSKQEVLVLNPSYKGLMHAIDLMMLTPAERAVAHAIVDPEVRPKYERIPLVQNAIRRMSPRDPAEVMTTAPMVFYAEFVKPFLAGKDAYRTYRPQLMINVKELNKSPVTGQVINPKPLFKRARKKATTDVSDAYADITTGEATPDVRAAYADIQKSWKDSGKQKRSLFRKPKLSRPKKGKTT